MTCKRCERGIWRYKYIAYDLQFPIIVIQSRETPASNVYVAPPCMKDWGYDTVLTLAPRQEMLEVSNAFHKSNIGRIWWKLLESCGKVVTFPK